MSSQKRVAVYRQEYLRASETFVREHVRSLRRYRPTLLTSNLLAGSTAPDGVPLVVAGRRPAERLAARLDPRRRGDELRRQERALARALRRIGPDLLHVHFGADAAVVVRVAHELGLPMVVTWHGYDATRLPAALRQSAAGRLLLERRQEVLSCSRRTIAVSGYLAAALERHGADPRRLRTVPCGVDTEAFGWSEVPAGGPLLFVGRLVEKKGLADLLSALARVPDAPPLVVVGDGGLRAELQAQSERLGVDARFLGAQPAERVRTAMREARVVVMPSKRAADGDCEGMPVVSVEAAASGRPVVAYAHSGLTESVQDGHTGLLVPEGDVDGLRDALSSLLADPERQAEMGRAARRLAVAHFDLRRTTGRIEDVYDEVLAGG